MAFRQAFRNKVILTFFDETGENVIWSIDFFLPSAEEAGMLAYMIRRCLTHMNFAVSQERWTTVGFVPVDAKQARVTNNVKEAFEELERTRSERFQYRMTLRIPNDQGVECPFNLTFYFSTLGSSEITYTLLMEGTRSLKKELICEAKNRETLVWESRVPGMFVPKDLALPIISLNETSKSTALKYLKELLASEEK